MSKRRAGFLALSLIPIGLLMLLIMASTDEVSETRVATVANGQSFVPTGVWSDLPVFPNVVLNFGGSPSNGNCVGTSASGPLKLKRAAAVAYPPTGKVYIMGGRHRADGDDINSEWIYEYTPGASSYTLKNARLDACYYSFRYTSNMAAGVLTDTNGVNIYLVSGSNVDSVITPTVRIYNPVADTVTRLLSDPWPASPMRIPGGYAVYNNKLYIFGGYGPKPTSTMYADTWVFDPMAPAGSKWSQLGSANLGMARTSIGGAALDGYIYAIGGDVISGVVSTTVTPQTIVERMNPSLPSPTWQAVASLPTARGDVGVWSYDSGTGYEISGKIVIAGGKYPVPDSNAYIYDPVSDSWSTFTPMLRARRNVGYTQWAGILYAFGGYNVGATYDGANDSMRYDASGVVGTPTDTPIPANTPTRTNTLVPTNTPTRTNTSVPPTVTVTRTNTPIPPSNTATNTPTNTPTRTNTSVPPTSTSLPPTITPVPPSTTATVASNTPTRTVTSVPPTNTAIVPTSTPIPPSNTSVPPPSSTPVLLTRTNTPVPPSSTHVPTDTPVPPSNTPVPPTPTVCTLSFSDVLPGSTFHPYVMCLACRGIVSGYDDGTFRPDNKVTRGQVAKIVSNSAGFDDPPGAQIFADVLPGSTFFDFVQRLASRGYMNGYPCGGPGEPCGGGSLPYFRPGQDATRGQIAKIVSNATGFSDPIGPQIFQDVLPGSTFYDFIQRLAQRGIVDGYPCGGPGELCVPPGNLPYFRPNATTTRGQATKIASLAFFPDCQPFHR